MMVEEPEVILECETKQLRKKRVKHVKVLWKNMHGGDIAWELEDDIRVHLPNIFILVLDSGAKFS